MALMDAFGYAGKRVAVLGGATGMGAASAALAKELGAEVIVLDYAPVTLEGVKAIQVNLADKASIDAAVPQLGGPIDALFSCAGVDEGTPGIEKINWVGHKYFLDLLMKDNLINRGGSVGFISSQAGLGWEPHLDTLKEWIEISDYDEAAKWAVDSERATYTWCKRAICAFVAWKSYEFLQKGIRVNAIMPGPTDTPLARANADRWLGFGADFREAIGRGASTPEEQASVLVFLGSPAAAAINGITLLTDMGLSSAGITDAFPPAKPILQYFLSGA